MTQQHEPALPSTVKVHKHDPVTGQMTIERLADGGLTAIEHAAIHTGQPCSGTPWLDDMLAKARRERLAGQIAAGAIANSALFKPDYTLVAYSSVTLADTLIAALEGGEM